MCKESVMRSQRACMSRKVLRSEEAAWNSLFTSTYRAAICTPQCQSMTTYLRTHSGSQGSYLWSLQQRCLLIPARTDSRTCYAVSRASLLRGLLASTLTYAHALIRLAIGCA